MIAERAPSAEAARAGHAWPVADCAPLGCVSMTEAIRRALNSDAYSGTRNRLGIKSWLYRLAQANRDGEPAPAVFGGELYIPTRLHPALCEPMARPADVRTINELPAAARSRAVARLRALRAFEEFCRTPQGGGLGLVEARRQFAATRGAAFTYRDGNSVRTLEFSDCTLARWEKSYRKGGVDELAGDARGKWQRTPPDQAAVDLYWSIRMDPRAFSIATAWRRVSVAAKAERWRWFNKLPTCAAWDRRTRDERAIVLNQRGELKYQQQAGAYIEPDPESWESGEHWIGDDSTINAWVKWRGKIIRPVISAWLDWRSRTLVGFRIVAGGNEHSLLLGFRDGANRFGLPGSVKIDNGRNFSAYSWRGDAPKRRQRSADPQATERIEGLYALANVRTSWAQPYSPNAKARLERWFGTFDDQCVRAFPSYCGATPDDRPDDHARLVEQAVEFDDLVKAIAHYVEIYNATPHSGEGMDGRAPLQVMALAPRKRVLPDGVAKLLLQTWHRPVSIGRNGVAIRVAGATIRYGAWEPALRALPIGTKLRVAFDPADLRSVTVLGLDYRFICTVEANQRINQKFDGEAVRQTMREKSRERRIKREAARIGPVEYLSDPVERTLAAQAADAATRRLPDSTPDSGPLLVPVQTPLKEPVKTAARLRKAVGAESFGGTDALADMNRRFNEFAASGAKDRAPRGPDSATARLRQWAEGKK